MTGSRLSPIISHYVTYYTDHPQHRPLLITQHRPYRCKKLLLQTTVTEWMLACSNFVHKVGRVDQGTTVTDFDPEEQERGITIQAAAITFDWKGTYVQSRVQSHRHARSR